LQYGNLFLEVTSVKGEVNATGWATVMVADRVYVYHFWPDGTVTRRSPEGVDCTVEVEEVSLPVIGQVIARGGGWPKGAFPEIK
jgi:hypothetical protein